MDDESRTLPVYILDESAYQRIGFLPPPFQVGVLRHRRVLEDQPPSRVLSTPASSVSGPRVYSSIEPLVASLAYERTAILVAFSKRTGQLPLRRIVERCRGFRCDLHLVLGDTLLDWRFEEEDLPGLLRWVGSVVQLSEGTAMEEMLPGCLESLAVALSGTFRARLRGHLIWVGSQRHKALDPCLDELASRLESESPKEFITASLQEGLETSLEEALGQHGFGGVPWSISRRSVGARIGVFCRPRREIDDA